MDPDGSYRIRFQHRGLRCHAKELAGLGDAARGRVLDAYLDREQAYPALGLLRVGALGVLALAVVAVPFLHVYACGAMT